MCGVGCPDADAVGKPTEIHALCWLLGAFFGEKYCSRVEKTDHRDGTIHPRDPIWVWPVGAAFASMDGRAKLTPPCWPWLPPVVAKLTRNIYRSSSHDLQENGDRTGAPSTISYISHVNSKGREGQEFCLSSVVRTQLAKQAILALFRPLVLYCVNYCMSIGFYHQEIHVKT